MDSNDEKSAQSPRIKFPATSGRYNFMQFMGSNWYEKNYVRCAGLDTDHTEITHSFGFEMGMYDSHEPGASYPAYPTGFFKFLGDISPDMGRFTIIGAGQCDIDLEKRVAVFGGYSKSYPFGVIFPKKLADLFTKEEAAEWKLERGDETDGRPWREKQDTVTQQPKKRCKSYSIVKLDERILDSNTVLGIYWENKGYEIANWGAIQGYVDPRVIAGIVNIGSSRVPKFKDYLCFPNLNPELFRHRDPPKYSWHVPQYYDKQAVNHSLVPEMDENATQLREKAQQVVDVKLCLDKVDGLPAFRKLKSKIKKLESLI